MKKTSCLAVVWFMFLATGAARAQLPSPRDMTVYNGVCTEQSHIAEGQQGEDLTKRQSRVYCDTAVLTRFPNNPRHVMINFAQKQSHTGQPIGFAGTLQPDGIMVQVDRVYLTPSVPLPVTDGACKLFTNGRQVTDVFCAAAIDTGQRRTSAILALHVQ